MNIEYAMNTSQSNLWTIMIQKLFNKRIFKIPQFIVAKVVEASSSSSNLVMCIKLIYFLRFLEFLKLRSFSPKKNVYSKHLF